MKKMGPINDNDLVLKARALKKTGYTCAEIARWLGIDYSTAHRWTDEEYAAKRWLQNRMARIKRQRRTGTNR